MILTQKKPFTKKEIVSISKEYGSYIKTVIDLKKKICSAGAHMHFESEKILLDRGSDQQDLWGGGIDIEEKLITFNSFINIRPSQKNTSNEIQNTAYRKEFEKLTKFFFQLLYE